MLLSAKQKIGQIGRSRVFPLSSSVFQHCLAKGELVSVQVGKTLFLAHPIVENATIDDLHHELEPRVISPAEYRSVPLGKL